MPQNFNSSIKATSSASVVADMHIHSTESDGKRSPQEIVEMALQRGLSAIAISDHDALTGIDHAIEAAKGTNLEIIPAIELSTVDENRSIHILGYYFDHHSALFSDLLSEIIRYRAERAEQMVQKLNEIGVEITIADVKRTISSEFFGRIHIAQAMLDKGYISDRRDAFTADYIGKGGAAYVNRFKMSVQEAISLIHRAGGWAVIAHPGENDGSMMLEEQDIRKFMQWGLDGMEVFTSKHTPQKSDRYQEMAEKLGLIITGGSDYHGKHNLCVGDYGLSKKQFSRLQQRIQNDER